MKPVRPLVRTAAFAAVSALMMSGCAEDSTDRPRDDPSAASTKAPAQADAWKRPTTFTPAKAPTGWDTSELFDHHLTIATPTGWSRGYQGGGAEASTAEFSDSDGSARIDVLYQPPNPSDLVLDGTGAERVFQGWAHVRVTETQLDGADIAYYCVGDETSDADSPTSHHGAALVFQIHQGPKPIFGWVVVVQRGPASSEDLTAVLTSVALK